MTTRRNLVIQYVWIKVGDIEVEVGDIEDNADERSIINQIYAMGMGWA